MKVKLMMLSLLGAVALPVSVSAQTQSQTTKPASDLIFEKSCSTGWFATLQGGVDFMALKGNSNVSLKDALGFMPSLSIGKYVNPYFATRLQVNAGKVNTHGCKIPVQNNKFVGAHYDFMFDLVNYFATYKADRVFHVIPFLGAGYEYKFDSDKGKVFPNVHTLTANGGLQLGASLAKQVDFVLEGMATYNNLPINKAYPMMNYNGLRVSLTAGLKIKLGTPSFNVVTPMDYALADDLNNQISHLRAENAELAKRPESCPECPEVVEATVKASFLTQKAVLFKYGKSNVSKDQLIHLYDASQLVNSDGGTLVLTGYISKNERRIPHLAEKRAKSVAQILISDFGVSPDNIIIEWKEAGDEAYENQNSWNRVVVIRYSL